MPGRSPPRRLQRSALATERLIPMSPVQELEAVRAPAAPAGHTLAPGMRLRE
jgi:hypothetical protein